MVRGGGAESLIFSITAELAKIEGTEVHVLSIKSPLDMEFTNILEQNRVKCFWLSKSLHNPFIIYKLHRFIKSGGYDIVNVHLFPSLYYVGLAKLIYGLKSKLVYTEHSTNNRRRGKPLFILLDRLIYKQYNKIITITKEVDLALKKQVPNANTQIVNNGVDVKRFISAKSSNLSSLGVPVNCNIVTMVARFCFMKDYKTLIKAMAYLDNVHLLCVGDGPLKDEHVKFAQDLSLSNRVHFLGQRKDVANILRTSDIIVLSSEHEGFSISMLEAMSCKKPFLGSDVPGIRDVVPNTAMLFKYQDDEDLANKIKTLLLDNKLYDDISEQCFLFAQKYDISVVANNYMKVYKNII